VNQLAPIFPFITRTEKLEQLTKEELVALGNDFCAQVRGRGYG
jgi:hypothetical protein